MGEAANRCIPVWPVVADSYCTTLANVGYAVRVSWAWVFVSAVALAWLDFQLIEPGSISVGHSILSILVLVVAFSSVAVAWHRKLLLSESATGSKLLLGDSVAGSIYLRLDKTVWRYIGFTFLIALMTMGVPMALMEFSLFLLPSEAQATPDNTLWEVAPLVAGLLGFLGFVVGLILAPRLWLVLPAIALDMKGVSLGTAWRLTRANTLRLALGNLLCLWPYAIFYALLVLTGLDRYHPGDDVPERLLGRLAEVSGNLLVGLIALSFLTFSFRFFFEPEIIRGAA